MRGSGILLPISALPSPYGIGTLGKDAYRFVDFLVSCKQKYWQILPCGPTGYGDSPYQSFSAYAGNPYWIDLDTLVREGLLRRSEIKNAGFIDDPKAIHYSDLYEKRLELLEKAAARISITDTGLLSFMMDNSEWLDDFSLFMSIKTTNKMAPFQSWPRKYRLRDEESITSVKKEYRENLHFWAASQFLFYKQWENFRKYANDNGVKIIGDIPIYVSPDSSDIWADHKLFQVNKDRKMTHVAGCPPDNFDSKGQRWGNPLYDWGYHKKLGYDWWVKRLRHAGKIYDIIRIDHFRGFAGYYSIPAKNTTAEYGKWKKGPGKDFIAAIKTNLPDLEIIAEDLGFLTPDVINLLEFSGFPGMKVLQFAFDGATDNTYAPHMYTANSVAYTGTHDNPTTVEWSKIAGADEIKNAKKYLNVKKRTELTNAIVNSAMNSKSDICIIPIQDWLGLGSEARINTPGTTENNWRFRLGKRKLSSRLTEKILKLTESSGR